jgi:hypothetical protein
MEELLANPATVTMFLQLFKMGLSFGATYLKKKWEPNESDENAAWAMYVEMITK